MAWGSFSFPCNLKNLADVLRERGRDGTWEFYRPVAEVQVSPLVRGKLVVSGFISRLGTIMFAEVFH